MSVKDDLNAMKKQAEKTAPKKTDQKFSGQELLKKYFVPRVADGQTSTKFKVRVIPNPKGGTPIQEVKFHQVKVGPSWKKFLCLDEVGEACPFCDTAAAFYAEGDKESAKPYRSQLYYIIRVLERGNEADGVKFWRFKDKYDKSGEFNKIQAILDDFDILSTNDEGYDLHITCSLNEKNRSIVSSILCVKPAPLASSVEAVDALVNDDTTWKDIFKPQEAQYLEDVIAGKAQYWDASLKKYVKPGQDTTVETSTTDGDKSTTKKIDNPLMKDEKIDEANIVTNSGDDDDDDLPF